jgi:hypothetical protein
MAQYTILTNRTQEIGLKFAYDNYADKIQFPTQQSYLQFCVSNQITNPMFLDYERAQAIAFDQSFETIPESNQAKAQQEIEAVIIANGGEIVPVGPPGLPPLIMRSENARGATATPGESGGIIPTPGGETSDPVQAGETDKGVLPPSGSNGERDNET